MQQMTPDLGVADAIGRGGQREKREDGGDADELEQAVEQDQPQHAKQLEPAIGQRHAVASRHESEKGKNHKTKLETGNLKTKSEIRKAEIKAVEPLIFAHCR